MIDQTHPVARRWGGPSSEWLTSVVSDPTLNLTAKGIACAFQSLSMSLSDVMKRATPLDDEAEVRQALIMLAARGYIALVDGE